MLVSTAQQSESVLHIHISPLFWISFPFRSPRSTEWSSPCYTVGSYICFINSIYMSIPISRVIPLPPIPLGIHTFVLYVSVSISALQISSFMPFYYIINIQYLFFSDLLHSVWQLLGSSMSLQMIQLCSFYGWVILHCIHVPHLLCPLPCWCIFRFFPVLAIVKSAAVNTGADMSFWIMVFSG